MLWHIQLKFCTWLCYTVLQIKFEFCQFASIFVGVMPLLELRILKIHSFLNFSLTCFDILSWNFAHDFVLLKYRQSSSVVILRQFLWELCPFWNIKYRKYTVFRTFLLGHIKKNPGSQTPLRAQNSSRWDVFIVGREKNSHRPPDFWSATAKHDNCRFRTCLVLAIVYNPGTSFIAKAFYKSNFDWSTEVSLGLFLEFSIKNNQKSIMKRK